MFNFTLCGDFFQQRPVSKIDSDFYYFTVYLITLISHIVFLEINKSNFRNQKRVGKLRRLED